ncbi:selenide, water dikinase SelD [Paracoccus aerodenitrificans]|uniref:selenide, water dikinase SelD n=1 Tax=Paracoccus aerodenitrificans TaxID=3017781 RepID=UPI0022F06FEE|nr:selenide, water dikinase SelD [Paracoccus aerodenitrificans]WBU65018.1 selenide, water dikinase SelD [Paracoccus aerodenitrificans]
MRLTELAHGGGCGCKLGPAVLRDLLADQPIGQMFPQLLVGNAESDDAAVWQIDENTCMIATTDFFMPMVDNPRDFGRIAATNAISDIYAMGGRPVMALAILGMPINVIDPSDIREILAGGADICAEAGIPIAGGHSIDAPEPIYGLAVIGLCAPGDLRRNGGALPGDALILTKPLGVGIYSNAIKKGIATKADIAEMIDSCTTLNRIGQDLSKRPEVHAITDVTGFGILGHGMEMARAAGCGLRIERAALPLLNRAAEMAQSGLRTGASDRNWDAVGDKVTLPTGITEAEHTLLTDPQTSGGLLVSVAADAAESVLDQICSVHPKAAIIGTVIEGAGIEIV